jgi:hypothetical protein
MAPEKRSAVLTKKAEWDEVTDRRTGETKAILVLTVVLNGDVVKWRVNKNTTRKLARELGSNTDLWEGTTVRLGWERFGAVESISADAIVKLSAVPHG